MMPRGELHQDSKHDDNRCPGCDEPVDSDLVSWDETSQRFICSICARDWARREKGTGWRSIAAQVA